MESNVKHLKLLQFPDNCGEYCAESQENPLAWEGPGIGRALVFMTIQGVLFFLILFLIESGYGRATWQKIVAGTNRSQEELSDDSYVAQLAAVSMDQLQVAEDSDVRQEAQRVAQTPLKDLLATDSLVLKDIKKYYGPFLAVDGLSVGIPQGECFGLLGVNGAGKTTTFKMLTGDETVSVGNAYLGGYSVVDHIKQVETNIRQHFF